MQVQIACFGAKIGTRGCFLDKNGGLKTLMAHSWARLPGLTSQASGGWLEIEASVTIMSVPVAFSILARLRLLKKDMVTRTQRVPFY